MMMLDKLEMNEDSETDSNNLANVFSTPLRGSGGPSSQQLWLQKFYGNVLDVASLRIDAIKKCLGANSSGPIILSENSINLTNGIFAKIMVQHPKALQNRHIDQIIMCIIYAICKAQKLCKMENLFNILVKSFITLPHTKMATFKEVWVENGSPLNIIDFYNKVFIEQFKYFFNNLTDENIAETETFHKRLRTPTPLKTRRTPIIARTPLSYGQRGRNQGFSVFLGQSPGKPFKDFNNATSSSARRNLDFSQLAHDEEKEAPNTTTVPNNEE
eukprot:TRINITY_DN6568_c0_g1_i4.p1 TRINITY_DN6568_c0_g1~~TRINITY_DN6568_c0_g1_i4.p1  ORF type:complete len:272 (+),score=54.64 TRINITY_DN6568_c0_g1_i4:157-972(+)